MNWFQTAKTEVEKVEQKAEEIAISLNTEALQAVKDAIAKAKSVVPQPTPAPPAEVAPESAPAP